MHPLQEVQEQSLITSPFYFSSERDPDHELTPSQEEVVDFTNEVDRNVKTPSGMMAMLKKHMLEKHQNNEYAGCTQHSALNLTPGENENATFDRAYEKLTEEANIRQYAETLRRADENHCQFYNKTSGGSVEDYQLLRCQNCCHAKIVAKKKSQNTTQTATMMKTRPTTTLTVAPEKRIQR